MYNLRIQILRAIVRIKLMIMMLRKSVESNTPDSKMSLTEFLNKYSLRFKAIVESCRNELELGVAENYIRTGLNSFVAIPDSDNANEYVKLLIIPKRMEFNKRYEDGLLEQKKLVC